MLLEATQEALHLGFNGWDASKCIHTYHRIPGVRVQDSKGPLSALAARFSFTWYGTTSASTNQRIFSVDHTKLRTPQLVPRRLRTRPAPGTAAGAGPGPPARAAPSASMHGLPAAGSRTLQYTLSADLSALHPTNDDSLKIMNRRAKHENLLSWNPQCARQELEGACGCAPRPP